MTGCDANSGFYGKGIKLVYDRVAKSPEAHRQLSRCGNSIDIEEDVLQDLLQFTREVIYGNKKSSTMAEARSFKWKTLKNKAFILLLPDEESLRQHCAVQTAWRILYYTPQRSTTPRRSDMVGSWWVIAVTRSATHSLLSRLICLCWGEVRRARKMIQGKGKL